MTTEQKLAIAIEALREFEETCCCLIMDECNVCAACKLALNKIQSPQPQAETRVAREFWVIENNEQYDFHSSKPFIDVNSENLFLVREVLESNE